MSYEARLPLDTRHIINPENNERYCAYCGKKIEADYDYEIDTNFYHCDCEDALKEIAIIEKIGELGKEMPSPKYELTKKTVIEIKKIGDL